MYSVNLQEPAPAPMPPPGLDTTTNVYYPFENATVALLTVFFGLSNIKKNELELLLSLLRNNDFLLSDVPINTGKILDAYLARPGSNERKQKGVKTPVGGFPLTPVTITTEEAPVESHVVQIIHPVHTVRMALALPSPAHQFQFTKNCSCA